MVRSKHIISIVLSLVLVACGKPTVPDSYTNENRKPAIMPDYTDVTIPSNICPLNFNVHEPGNEVVVRLSVDEIQYVCGEGKKALIEEDEWTELISKAKGRSIKVEVFVNDNGNWKAYTPFDINVAEDEIDRYISYRLIQPSYVAYEKLVIAQRDLTTYEETNIFDNMQIGTEANGQCINCHSYQNYKTDRMLFHMRQGFGGTMIYDNGALKKVDMKVEQTISSGVYPSWHPTENLVAFSTNLTGQTFHTKDHAKVEVQDRESDLILYDVDKNEVYSVANDSNELEIFPTWSPDGKTLYYCSAYFKCENESNRDEEVISRYRDFHYNIYAKAYNPKNRSFGERQLIYDAAADTTSATLPRISPDGRYMVFSLGKWGCFHVWHKDADIYVMDLKTKQATPLTALNSDYSESYPSFSSNGRWIITASRRDDGNYTRPYISYFDKNGVCHKAFELPQKDPNFYTSLLYSYNRPEFMKEAVKTTPKQLAIEAKKEASKAKFVK